MSSLSLNQRGESPVSLDQEMNKNRIIPRQELTVPQLGSILKDFGLTMCSNLTASSEGRIASNVSVLTQEMGDVIVRAYPASYSSRKVDFEVAVLMHFSGLDISVPQPLATISIENKDAHISRNSELQIFVYKKLSGNTLQRSELNSDYAKQGGEVLRKLLRTAANFVPSNTRATGDIEFVFGLLRAFKEQQREFACSEIASAMEDALMSEKLYRCLEGAPKGLVHADYFFENVLVNNGNICAVLDFGDAYYGALVNDIVIGAMEFSVLADRSWDKQCLKNFLIPLVEELRVYGLTPNQLIDLMRVNCVRFSIYTLPISQANGEKIEENEYVQRFLALTSGKVREEIENLFIDLIKQ